MNETLVSGATRTRIRPEVVRILIYSGVTLLVVVLTVVTLSVTHFSASKHGAPSATTTTTTTTIATTTAMTTAITTTPVTATTASNITTSTAEPTATTGWHNSTVSAEPASSARPSTISPSRSDASTGSPTDARAQSNDELSSRWQEYLREPGRLNSSDECGRTAGATFPMGKIHLYPYERFGMIWSVYLLNDDVCAIVLSEVAVKNPQISTRDLNRPNGLERYKYNFEFIRTHYKQLPYNLTAPDDLVIADAQAEYRKNFVLDTCMRSSVILPVKQCKAFENRQYLIDIK